MLEALAAATILSTKWDKTSPFINPMCGSGTLAIEAALIATNRTPGLLRNNYAFMHLQGFKEEWYTAERALLDKEIKEVVGLKIIATDISPQAITIAKTNAAAAGVADLIEFATCDFERTTIPEFANGVVMLNPEYIMGAIVCAKSLKNVTTVYPIVCMVTNDILEQDPNAMNILLSVFDDVVVVPIIEHNVLKFESIRQKEMYNHWINKSFTKWNCLTLSKDGILYDKVILLDVDMIMVTNCDELFELNAPAGCFSQPWAFPYQVHGAVPNPYIKCNKEWLQNKDIPHAATVKYKTIAVLQSANMI
jgi:alpha-N-acetylglucosamine transferase